MKRIVKIQNKKAVWTEENLKHLKNLAKKLRGITNEVDLVTPALSKENAELLNKAKEYLEEAVITFDYIIEIYS